MKIRIVVSHCLGAGIDVAEGDVLEVTPAEARRKIQMGYAVAIDPLPPSEGMVHFAQAGPVEKVVPEVPAEVSTEIPAEVPEGDVDPIES